MAANVPAGGGDQGLGAGVGRGAGFRSRGLTTARPSPPLPPSPPLFHALGSGGHADICSELQWPLEDWRHDAVEAADGEGGMSGGGGGGAVSEERKIGWCVCVGGNKGHTVGAEWPLPVIDAADGPGSAGDVADSLDVADLNGHDMAMKKGRRGRCSSNCARAWEAHAREGAANRRQWMACHPTSTYLHAQVGRRLDQHQLGAARHDAPAHGSGGRCGGGEGRGGE